MPYQEHTTVNSHKHVIDLVEAFLTAQGWTIDSSVNSTERELYVSKANGGETFYFSIKSTGANSLVLRANLAYPESGSSSLTYMNLKSTSMVRCWLFAGDLYCYVIVEVAAGYMQMGLFGRLVPYRAFSTTNKEGAFCFGNNNQAWSSLDSSSAAEQYFSLHRTGNSTGTRVRHVPVAGAEWGNEDAPIHGYGSSNYAYRESWLLSYLHNANGERPMLPIRISMPNNPVVTAGFQNSYPLGYLPDMRVMNFKNVVDASEQTIGADVWKRFPVPHQNVAVTPMYYGGTEMGYAFKK
jgi:hypothetical protein